MGLFGGISLILVGVLGAASLIIARKPEAKQLIDKIAPYQGWIGVGAALWGLTWVTNAVLSLGWLAYQPIYWIIYLVAGVLQTALGILLGINTLKMFVKQPAAVEKMDKLVAKLAPKQGILGFAAIGTGMFMIVAGFVFTVSAGDVLDDYGDLYAQNAGALVAGQMAGQMAMAQQQAAMAQAQAAAQQAALTAGQVPVAPNPLAQPGMIQGQVPVAAPVGVPAPVAAPATVGTMATALVQQSWAAGIDAQQTPLMGMDLYVTPPSGAPYQVRIPSHPVPAVKQALLQPQATINVSIDPANPQKVTPVL